MNEENVKDVPLLGNLDTEPQMTEMGQVDYDIFGVYDEGDQAFLMYWDLRDTWFAKKLMRKFQKTSIGIRGRGRIDALHGESVKHGSPADVNAMMRQPGVLDRLREVIQPGYYEEKEKKRLGINNEPI